MDIRVMGAIAAVAAGAVCGLALLAMLIVAITRMFLEDSVPSHDRDVCTSRPLRKPRWVQWLYAFLCGYYWAACPLCGKKFGAHEAGVHGLETSIYGGQQVCSECSDEAHRRSMEFYRKWQEREKARMG